MYTNTHPGIIYLYKCLEDVENVSNHHFQVVPTCSMSKFGSLSTWRLLFWQVMPLQCWSARCWYSIWTEQHLRTFNVASNQMLKDLGKAMASQHCLIRGMPSCTSRTDPCSCGSCECSLAPPDKGVAAEMCSWIGEQSALQPGQKSYVAYRNIFSFCYLHKYIYIQCTV